MENTEIMNNQTEFETIDDVTVVEECGDNQNEGKSLIGLAIGAVVVGVGIFLYKRSKKAEKRRVEKLRKKGYVIYEPNELDESKSEETVEYVDVEETPEN